MLQKNNIKLKPIIEDINFQNARIIIYIIFFISYIYFANYSNFHCTGCILCGMTRAVKCLLTLNLKKAFEYNKYVWVFCLIIPLIMLDIIFIFFNRFKYISNRNK